MINNNNLNLSSNLTSCLSLAGNNQKRNGYLFSIPPLFKEGLQLAELLSSLVSCYTISRKTNLSMSVLLIVKRMPTVGMTIFLIMFKNIRLSA